MNRIKESMSSFECCQENQYGILKAVIEEIDKMIIVVKSTDYQSTSTNIETCGYNKALKDIKQLLEDSIK